MTSAPDDRAADEQTADDTASGGAPEPRDADEKKSFEEAERAAGSHSAE
jgi:hypothetical protein